jgi:hypothetical protein
LLARLGYQVAKDDGRYTVGHPESRKAVFVGDLVDRGPNTPEVIRLVRDATAAGAAFCVETGTAFSSLAHANLPLSRSAWFRHVA